MKKKFMENSLSVQLKDVLKIMQAQSYNNTYFGIPTIKSPLDFWVYQEIIYETKPDIIVEIGNFRGGHLLALAHLFDQIHKNDFFKNKKIIGIDIDQKEIPKIVRAHPRIKLIEGDGVESFEKVKKLIKKNYKVLIIEDSSHTYENTLKILRTYNSLVTKKSYFIIEDSICHHGLDVGPNPGPYEAIETFEKENKKFKIDRDREQFLITWNPKGYLKRIK